MRSRTQSSPFSRLPALSTRQTRSSALKACAQARSSWRQPLRSEKSKLERKT